MMHMPALQEEHRKLEALAGTWAGEETLYPSPWDAKGGTAMGRCQSKIDLDGFFLVSDYQQERDGKVCYRGHGVIGFDGNEKVYTLSWFDSMGGGSTTAARGRWDGNRLVFQQEHPMGHSRYTYLLEGDGRYTFMLEMSQDGKQWAPFMEGKYKRR